MKKSSFFVLLMIAVFFGSAMVAYADTYRNVFIMNDVFMNFDIISNQPQTKINDSSIVHEGGRIDYFPDGKYILINGKSYYDLITSAYGKDKIANAWNKAFGGDFDQDVTQYYHNREAYNISHELDLKAYWEKKKASVTAGK